MDTRQDPHNRPDLKDAPDEFEQPDTITDDHLEQIDELVAMHHSLENYLSHLEAAGPDGLSRHAKRAMQMGLNHIDSKLNRMTCSLEDSESTETDNSSLGNRIKEIAKRIYQFILKLIDQAKQYAKKVIGGSERVKSKAEELLKQIRDRTKPKPANELHNEASHVTVNSPGILFADGHFCLAECRTEQEIIKFFLQTYPQYTKDQINKLTKAVKSYDVESGDVREYESISEFVGKHVSLVASIADKILPGNKKVEFRYTALGPYLGDADAKDAPSEYSFEARHRAAIEDTLKQNIATMNAVAKLLKAEASILDEMRELSQQLMGLQNRRGETVWRSAREALDKVCTDSMELFQRIRPDYGPISAHLTRIGKARNDVCELELKAHQ
ncbi:internal head protein [Pseudomonas phage PhiPA3]|uniref:Virion structural protein n=1 Tax=Pseudomonas phage PhiPA3 TaxID=998086 RepID=F8SJX6_BPPA3|nr:internal head protein [Pseudomonas phage PhiPA3]AEH03523.1 virion structural protein [Pseudomonas phage PhiPA3]